MRFDHQIFLVQYCKCVDDVCAKIWVNVIWCVLSVVRSGIKFVQFILNFTIIVSIALINKRSPFQKSVGKVKMYYLYQDQLV